MSVISVQPLISESSVLKPVRVLRSLSKRGKKNPTGKKNSRYLETIQDQLESPLGNLENLRKVRKNLNFDCQPVKDTDIAIQNRGDLDALSEQSNRLRDSQVAEVKEIQAERADVSNLNKALERQSSQAETEKPLVISRTNSLESNTTDGAQDIPSEQEEDQVIICEEVKEEKVIDEKISNEICYIERYYEGLKETEFQFTPQNCLARHEVKPVMRAKMLDWLQEVFGAYKFTDSCYFLTVNIMDRYFWLSQKSIKAEELHLVGMTCMFLASKYEEIIPLRLQTLQEKIAHNKYSIKDFKLKEKEIFQTLDYSLTGSNVYSFMKVTLQALKLQDLLGNQEECDFIERICVYMAKMLMFDYNLINKFSTRALAASSIYVALKLYEQCLNKSIVQILDQVRDFLELNNQEIVESATSLLNLARNFEQTFPQMRNLQNFNAQLLMQLAQRKNGKQQNKENLQQSG